MFSATNGHLLTVNAVLRQIAYDSGVQHMREICCLQLNFKEWLRFSMLNSDSDKNKYLLQCNTLDKSFVPAWHDLIFQGVAKHDLSNFQCCVKWGICTIIGQCLFLSSFNQPVHAICCLCFDLEIERIRLSLSLRVVSNLPFGKQMAISG